MGVGVAQKLLLSDRAISGTVALLVFLVIGLLRPAFMGYLISVGEASNSDRTSLLMPGLSGPGVSCISIGGSPGFPLLGGFFYRLFTKGRAFLSQVVTLSLAFNRPILIA